jgi:hypothetical protein
MSTEPETPEQPLTLTDEQRAKMDEWLRANPYGDQDENGVDLGSLRRNLQLTPTQRLWRLQSAINSLRKLQGV